MLGARTFPGNPYDGHILSAVLEQAANLTQDIAVKLKHIVVDLGFRGVDADNPDKVIIHRGKFKSLSKQQKGWLRRRTAVEPAIGHLKSDHRMDRCWLQGALGDALHSISCAAGYNVRWLMRAIGRLGIGPAFLRLLQAALSQLRVPQIRQGPAAGIETGHQVSPYKVGPAKFNLISINYSGAGFCF